MKDFISVITTINPPSLKLEQSLEKINHDKSRIVIVGDLKTPYNWSQKEYRFLSYEDQLKSQFGRILPVNHYARKNIGYLEAFDSGVNWIYETDDDNFHFDSPTSLFKNTNTVFASKNTGWINFYPLFSSLSHPIWPRGFPLDCIFTNTETFQLENFDYEFVGLVQGLANGDPDVDAIYRLTSGRFEGITFTDQQTLVMAAGQYIPLNSQTTWWKSELFRLMYLPASCTFRVTDILRGYIALIACNFLNLGLTVSSPVVFQDRNEHNLLKDFEDEIPLYSFGGTFVNTLVSEFKAERPKSITQFMKRAYEIAKNLNIVSQDEFALLNAWLEECDLRDIKDSLD